MKRVLISALAFMATVFASSVLVLSHAQQQPASSDSAAVEKLFITLDQNKDGHISKAEAKNSSLVAPQFELLDGDKDGALSKTEFMGLQTKS